MRTRCGYHGDSLIGVNMKKIFLNDRELCLNFISSEGFSDTREVKRSKNGYVVTRKIKNVSDKTLRLSSLGIALGGIFFGGKPENDYFYCNENARLFCTLTVPIDYNRLDDSAEENKRFNLPVDRKWCDPRVDKGKICSSPYQPFPAILLSNYERNVGIVCGSLSQECFYHSFEIERENGAAVLKICSSFKGIAYREVLPNETLTDIIYIGETNAADNINAIFDGYLNVLRKYLKNNEGSKKTNRHSLIWDSWNDGIFRDVSHESLVKEARAVKRFFPTVEWFQLDDGYSAYCEKNVDLDAHGLGVAYEGDGGIDGDKFPDGLKAYTGDIKKIGLKPAIWIGGFCPVKTKIYREHPEWFIDYTYRVDRTQPLDVSQKSVREYMCYAIDKMLTEYGFEGVKHDFWSYAFEDRHDLLKHKDKSGYEYRDWWLSQMRSRLPDYGYMETGCDVSMGNPFIGKYVNNYRFGEDIAAGSWSAVLTTVFWGVAALSVHSGDLFIPNSDSIGLLPGLNDIDFMTAVNFQIITRSLVEISGRFSLVDENNPRLKILQRAVKFLNNGENVYFAKYDYRKKGVNLPEIIYINSAFDCDDKGYKTIAVFNFGEETKRVEFSNADVGLNDGSHEVEFVWKNRVDRLNAFSFALKPHESILLKIKK